MTASGIEWTDRTWNPVRGCSRVSEGCRNCYAERQAARFAGDGEPFSAVVDYRAGYCRGPDVDAGLRRRELAGRDDHRVAGTDAIYVPFDDWDRWARSVVLDACWEAQDAPEILDRAKALGWTP